MGYDRDARPLAYLNLVLFVNFRMTRRKCGSRTKRAASAGGYHLTWRSSFSGQRLRWRVTRSANTSTRQLALSPVSRILSYGYEPIGRLLTLPTTPASSKASFAAVSNGDFPRLGQPFGMIQRRVPRDVTNIIETCHSRDTAEPRIEFVDSIWAFFVRSNVSS